MKASKSFRQSAGVLFWVLCGVPVATIILAVVFYIGWLNHVSPNQFGITYHQIGGDISIQEHPGWYITSPLVRVTYVRTVPFQVTIPSGAKVINTKMVRFRKEGAKEYVQLQGFNYNMDSNLEDVLRGYAFSGHQYPFLEVIQDTTDVVLSEDKKAAAAK